VEDGGRKAGVEAQALDLLDTFEREMGQEFGDPYGVYRQFIPETAIYQGDIQTEMMGASASLVSPWDAPRFSILGYDENAQILKDAGSFSNRVLSRSVELTMGPNILTLDDPSHRIHRVLIQYAFTKKAMEEWRTDFVEPLVHEYLDDLMSGDPKADLMRQFSLTYPVSVIHRILGLPREQLLDLHTLAISLLLISYKPEIALRASEQLAQMLSDVVAQRRENPRSDVISALCTAVMESGERLTDLEIISFLRVLLPAGGETTTRLMGNLLSRLLNDPDLLNRVRADRGLVPVAIEESLRIDAPTQITARLCMRTQEVGGVEIPEGAPLLMVLAAGNRDPRRFADPDDFNLDRGPSAHLGFGLGPHMCIGMHMARMEVDVALNAFLNRMPKLRLDPDYPPPQGRGTVFFSPATVRVRWD
jgi:cytochrome P450